MIIKPKGPILVFIDTAYMRHEGSIQAKPDTSNCFLFASVSSYFFLQCIPEITPEMIIIVPPLNKF